MTERKTCSDVGIQLNNVASRLTAYYLAVGRIRAACNLVSQYISHDLYSALIAKYECV
jgi:hypothetical protein